MNCSGVGYTIDAIMIQNDANQYVRTGNKDLKILAWRVLQSHMWQGRKKKKDAQPL